MKFKILPFLLIVFGASFLSVGASKIILQLGFSTPIDMANKFSYSVSLAFAIFGSILLFLGYRNDKIYFKKYFPIVMITLVMFFLLDLFGM